ncbi:MAG: 3-hydroxyacyl-CoA dehydrogenase family protein, partial [Ottowia sp.]|nr:3-hydroxyacyl-CoA dehydrogenase family protein [Ottowia sp.]
DLVVEAVFEDMAVKKAVFAELERITRPDAILASNTSYLNINAIAASCTHPERVVGLHFFSPAHKMKLLEVVRTEGASPQALSTALGLARRLGKIAVVAGVCDGFIGNRIMSAYRAECDRMLVEGATPRLIDEAMTAYGFPMGLYAMQDLAGLDIGWAARKRRTAEHGRPDDYIEIADRL